MLMDGTQIDHGQNKEKKELHEIKDKGKTPVEKSGSSATSCSVGMSERVTT